jgi:competence protein ComEA
VTDLASRAGLRVDPGRGAVLAMAGVAGVVAVLVGIWVLSSRPHRLPAEDGGAAVQVSGAAVPAGGTLQSPLPGTLPGTPSAASQPTAGSAPTSAANLPVGAAAALVVDVVGKVHHPGVYRLPTAARVQDAVTAAGGMLAGVDPVSVNLARRLTDGEQVVIGMPAQSGDVPVSSQDGPGSSAVPGSNGPLDLNAATAEQLDALPGVGPVLAQRILDWRSQHGRFDSIDQLNSVSGIGDAKFADLKPLVTVS